MAVIRWWLVAVGCCFGWPGSSDAASCTQFFAGGRPPVLLFGGMFHDGVVLCNDDYAVQVSPLTKGPLWSAEDLTEENVQIARQTARLNDFRADDRLTASQQAGLLDYRDAGFDRGHMTPSGDEPGSAAQSQSFLLSNIVPQTAELNRGAWEGVESAVRGWAEQEGELFIVTGPGYNPDHLPVTIGPGHIPVPDVTWKAVYDPSGPGTGAYVCTNTTAPHCKITSVALLTALVGIDPFPALSPSLKATVFSMPPIRQSPVAMVHRSGRHKLLKEWGTRTAQKALKSLLRALVPR
ncbi:DNA/RNA non-specific endonuclease [Neokomagataea thailandica]|nr:MULTISPECIES: DNA/RNA non-specific endonuclease [Neokomagataea]